MANSKKKKLSMLAVLLVLVFVWFLYATLNYSGYCFKQDRWLSDKEKIRIAVDRMNKRNFLWIKNKNKKGDYIKIKIKSIPYKDVDDFLQRNTDCCKVVSYYYYDNNEGGPQPFEFWDYFFLGGGYVVQLNYSENYYDKEGIHKSYKVKRQSVISICGNEYHWQ